MTAESQPLDITNVPELSRLADEVRQTKRPRVWRHANEDVAMLVPLTPAAQTPMPDNPALAAVLANVPKDNPVARTAGILHTDQPFPGYDEEQEGAAIADALLTLIALPNLKIANKARLRKTFDWYVRYNLSFIDAYLAVMTQQQQLPELVSFDQNYDRVPGVRRVEP